MPSLGSMAKALAPTVANLAISKLNISDKKKEILGQITTIVEKILKPNTDNLKSALEKKKAEVGGSSINYLDGFGTDHISGFQILSAAGSVLYEYGGTGWDGDSKISELVEDFTVTHDYIHKEPDETGTYGLQSAVDQLSTGESLFDSNQKKLEQIKDIFEKYA